MLALLGQRLPLPFHTTIILPMYVLDLKTVSRCGLIVLLKFYQKLKLFDSLIAIVVLFMFIATFYKFPFF